LHRIEGHRQGANVVRDLTTYCRELEIGYLTLYSFSTENWRRPPLEVAGLMQLLEDYCAKERDTLMKHEIRLSLIGRSDRLPASTRQALESRIETTQYNNKMTLTLAIDYGSHEEIARAVTRLLAAHPELKTIESHQIAQYLDTASLPLPDVLIRTSGEQRVSNFLLWQIAYAELCFTNVRWPDFTRAEFMACLKEFAKRDRRFGAATSEQVGLL